MECFGKKPQSYLCLLDELPYTLRNCNKTTHVYSHCHKPLLERCYNLHTIFKMCFGQGHHIPLCGLCVA